MENTINQSLNTVRKFFEDHSAILTKTEKDTIEAILKRIELPSITNEQKDLSITLKNKGNDFYKEGALQEALEMYTKSLEADPTNYVVYSNRALIYLKLEQVNKAIDDCIKGIELEPSFTKFYIRLATIYGETNKKLALEYIEKGLAFEPENSVLLNMKEELSEEASPLDSFDPSTLDSILQNKSLQDMVQSFVKDKTPEELNDMMSKVLGSLGKKN